MNHYKKFESAARSRRVKAFLLTTLITGSLFALIFMGSDMDTKKYLPEFVVEWLDNTEEPKKLNPNRP